MTEILPSLDLPVLVLHRRGDRAVPLEKGHTLANLIPGAQLIEYEGEDHFSYVPPLDWVDDVERFITGTVTKPVAALDPGAHARVTSLGRFAVHRGDDEVPVAEWGSRHARQILKRLVAADGWPVTRDTLIDMLWPDEADMKKLGSRLSVRLSDVRRVLGGGLIADRDSVRLDLEAVSTDLHDLGTADSDESVVGAYGGEFLPEDLYDDWTAPVRQEARQRFSAAARRLAAKALTSGDAASAIALARNLVATDHYEESGHRLLVQALAASGDERNARIAHQAWDASMEELGLDVDPYEVVVS